MNQYLYCPKCKGGFEKTDDEGNISWECDGCGFVMYENSKPTASVFLVKDKQILRTNPRSHRIDL